MVANVPNYLSRYRRQAPVPDQPEENYLEMVQQIAMMAAPPPEMVSPPQWRNQRVGPTPPFVPDWQFRDDIFRAPIAPGTRTLDFDRMGSEDEYWNFIVPRVYGPQPPGSRTNPNWKPSGRRY